MVNRDIFNPEIALINDPTIATWTRATIGRAPETYFTNPASSTGKYHPICTFRDGGLPIHVKRATYMVNRLAEGWNVKGINRDITLAAIIIHDIAKVGRGQGCYQDYENHPILAEKYFEKDVWPESSNNIYQQIKDCVRFHMGPWTPASIRKPLGKYTPLELLVYTCDYIATTREMCLPVDDIQGVLIKGNQLELIK